MEFNMADSVNVKVAFTATATDGSPYFNTAVEYHSLPYTDFVQMEKMMAGLLLELAQYGEAKAGKK
jgi:hypothetical protein